MVSRRQSIIKQISLWNVSPLITHIYTVKKNRYVGRRESSSFYTVITHIKIDGGSCCFIQLPRMIDRRSSPTPAGRFVLTL